MTGDRTPTGDKTAQCGASSRIGLHYLVPFVGPCVLRADHDGPVHEDANGVQWTDPRPAKAGDLAALCPPPGDLRDQLREVLTREHYRRARERIEASPEEHCAAFADAVLPVVEAETARTEQHYKGVAEGLQIELRAAIKAQGKAEERAEQVETRVAELEAELNGYVQDLNDALNHNDETCEAVQRRDEAEETLAEVRRLQELTIAASSRAHAIEQAQDTLAILNRHTKKGTDSP